LEAFSRSVGPIYDLIQVLREQSAVLRRTRDLLLPRLMSGQLTLPEAEEAIPAAL
jgi:type I restriction enzyme S subunit